MTQPADAHVLELLASYEELLKTTTRALQLAKSLAAAHALKVRPVDLQESIDDIRRSEQKLTVLQTQIAAFKRQFRVH